MHHSMASKRSVKCQVGSKTLLFLTLLYLTVCLPDFLDLEALQGLPIDLFSLLWAL